MSTRPPIPQGNPPAYFIGRVYKKSLRPIVIISASCSAVWTLLWGISSFKDISNDRGNSLPDFVPFDIVLGALFCAAAVIEIAGIAAATMQRLAFVRLYAYGTVVAALLVTAAQIMGIALDFKFKGKLLDLCTKANTGESVVEFDGWWGATRQTLSAKGAADFCNSRFTRDMVANFAWLIVTAILAALFTSVVFSFYRQLLDPNFSRAPSSQIRMQAFAAHPPNAPYGAEYAPGQQYGAPRYGEPEYAPPYDPAKLPSYDGNGRQTPEKDGDHKQAFDRAPSPEGYHASAPATNPFQRRAEEP